MARIINVIYKPHLVTYKACENSKHLCVGVCNYKMIIETDDKEIWVLSMMDDLDLEETELDKRIESIKKGGSLNEERIPFERPVKVDDINEFIFGNIEQGDTPLDALFDTLSDIRESGALCTDEVKELLNKIQL